MEINPDIRTATAQTQPSEAERPHAQARLAEGTVVSGEITDLKQGTVTISTENGVLTAELSGRAIEAKIGDMSAFTVKYDDSGNLILAPVQIPRESLERSVVSDALALAGFKVSPENVKMALELLNNGLPLTKENLLKFNQALKLLGGDKSGEALFMLKNNLKISPGAAEALDKLVSGEAKLLVQLNSLADKISGIPDPVLRESISEIFRNPDPAGTAVKSIMSEPDPAKAAAKILQALNELPPDELRKFSEGLRQALASSEASPAQNKELADAVLKELVKTGESDPAVQPAVRVLAQAVTEAEQAIQPAAQPADKSIAIKISDAADILLSSKEEFFKSIDKTIAELLSKGELSAGDGASRDKTADIIRKIIFPAPPEDITPNERQYIEERIALASGRQPAKQPDRLRFDPRNSSPADADEFINGLRESLSTAARALSASAAPESASIMKELADIGRSLEFSAQLRDNLFVQLPVMINNHETNTELFVFKDARKKKKGGASTALIALDTVNLDRIETYIHKEGKSVNLQFRVKTDGIKGTLSQNLGKLEEQLNSHGLKLQSFSFGSLKDNFTVLDAPDGLASDRPAVSETLKDERRVIFDMRL